VQLPETENGKGEVPLFDWPGLMVKVLEINKFSYSETCEHATEISNIAKIMAFILFNF